jgi:hypothetical protein
MNRIIAILVITLFGVFSGFSQVNSDGYKKTEVFVGYTFSNSKVNQYDRDLPIVTNSSLGNTFRRNEKFEKGLGASTSVNFSRYLGGKADFSFNFNKRKGRVNGQNFEVKERLATYTLGFQIKDNSKATKSRIRPFANILAGIGNTKSNLKNCAAFGSRCPDSLNKNRYGFVGIAGGGLDIKVSENVSFRVIQADYMFGKITKGWRFGSGIVF